MHFSSIFLGGGGGRATEMEREISLDLKHGAEAKDYAKVHMISIESPGSHGTSLSFSWLKSRS